MAKTTNTAKRPVGRPSTKPFAIGKAYLIRTVTMALTGKVKAVTKVGGETFLTLDDAAWIADTGRFSDCIAQGEDAMSEVEAVETAFVNVGSIVDAFPWKHALPRTTK